MATRTRALRFALRPVFEPDLPDGAWWPQTAQIGHEMAQLCALWPLASGRIVRVLYAASDWDDHPSPVVVPGSRVRAECSLDDGDGRLVLLMGGGARRALALIPPGTSDDLAADLLLGFRSVEPRSSDAPPLSAAT